MQVRLECAACGAELFGSDTKFGSGTGWPSFWDPKDSTSVELHHDFSHFMQQYGMLLLFLLITVARPALSMLVWIPMDQLWNILLPGLPMP